MAIFKMDGVKVGVGYFLSNMEEYLPNEVDVFCM